MSTDDERRETPRPRAEDGSYGEQQEFIDLRDIFRRLGRGFRQALGLALLGLVIGAAADLLVSRFLPPSSSTKVVFNFPGFSTGQYPDGSKFEPDDLAAPDVIADALGRAGLDASSHVQAEIRAGLSVQGIMPADVAKERDRAVSLGQNPPAYIPDEYSVTLTPRHGISLNRQQRAALLISIIDAYRDKFERTYANLPLAFGDAFETLKSADYFEYVIVLPEEISSIKAFLRQQLDQAKNYRSPTTNLSFNDLLNQTELFSQIRLNATLGLISSHALSRDRPLAIVKMHYYLRTLQDQEQEAIEEERVVQDLLAKAGNRQQSYVLGIKSQASEQRPDAPLLDQGLIDSLVANDAYNLLVRRALDAGYEVKRIQAEKTRLLERVSDMVSASNMSEAEQRMALSQVDASLADLKAAYDDLVDKIRKTQADFSNQQFADAINLSDEIRTESTLKSMAEAGAVGLFLGAAFGMGLSLLGVFIDSRD